MANTEIETSKFLRALAEVCRQFADRLDAQHACPRTAQLGEVVSKDPPQLIPGRHALKVPEAAKAIGISRASMYQVVARGEVRAVRIGGRILIRVVELQRALDRLGD